MKPTWTKDDRAACLSYREACARFLGNAASKPSMYFQELIVMEAMLDGHFIAHWDLNKAEVGSAFNGDFGSWLSRHKHCGSVSCGWAYALDAEWGTESLEEASEAVGRALKLALEFLPTWVAEASGQA